jgi:hypothetical protein
MDTPQRIADRYSMPTIRITGQGTKKSGRLLRRCLLVLYFKLQRYFHAVSFFMYPRVTDDATFRLRPAPTIPLKTSGVVCATNQTLYLARGETQ